MAMSRRTFLGSLALTAGVGMMTQAKNETMTNEKAMTVTGAVEPEALGTVLPHEHLLVDFIGAAETSPDRYDPEVVFETVMPHLDHTRELGVDTLVECTPAYLARDPRLMARLSEASGIRILTNTGYYGAMDGHFLPPHAYDEDADALAARWAREWEDGIDDTGIRPGFIKTAVNNGPLSDMDRKLIQAAARTHHATGLPIASHTTDATAIRETMAVLREEEVADGAFIWVHAHTVDDTDLHVEAVENGLWVEFDGLSPESLDIHVGLTRAMDERGLLDHVLISHDAGWYSVGEDGGGDFRRFDTLFNYFIPALHAVGFDEAQTRRLIRANPQQAFRIHSI